MTSPLKGVALFSRMRKRSIVFARGSFVSEKILTPPRLKFIVLVTKKWPFSP
jgi:hypothetical protein